jgi:hypothetical protein
MAFSQIRLWYRKTPGGQWLPMMARTVADQDGQDGDVSIVQLVNPVINGAGGGGEQAALDPASFNTERPEGWSGRTEPWRDPVGREPAAAGDK